MIYKLSLDNKINALKPGQSLKLSESENTICSVERSGNGKTLRFVRTFKDGSFEVFKKSNF